jgi:putative membrane protein
VDDGGREPDYRFTLANERTLLAWIRTVLALDAGGLGIVRFAPRLWFDGARELVGAFLVVLGSVTAAVSYRRWATADRAIRAGAPLPTSRLPRVLSVSLAGLSAVLVVLLVLDRLAGGG